MTASVAHHAHKLAGAALDWLHTHRRLGAFPEGATDIGDPDRHYKPLGETALAASLVLREGVAGPATLAQARELLDFAWSEFRAGDLLYERQLRHWLLTDPLETYAHFARAGLRHDRLHALLRHSAAVGATTEVLPNRNLAVANARRTTGIGRDPDWPALTRATWLGRTPEPWAIDWSTGYHLTHTVFHLTDWGARPHDLPGDIADYLAMWLPAWVDVWAEVAQWDLVGELLIVGACLPEPHLDPAEWRVLADAQHADGLLPRDNDPVDDDPATRFADHQHPAVVAVIAGTLALSRLLGA
ncbi:hypothetical protein GCM10010492_74840 [Saccharothrix mutabilis subsp. mutabilis]|uniref:DUF6895 domain-containing protein n=1 Tax=Saccharothrix mutabilis subsp. mutabilis TaxID=66855 RepID=A0ABN0UVI0_9PSEU